MLAYNKILILALYLQCEMELAIIRNTKKAYYPEQCLIYQVMNHHFVSFMYPISQKPVKHPPK